MAFVAIVALVCTGCAGKKKKAQLNPEAEEGEPLSVQTYERGMEYLTQSSMRQARRELESVEYAPGSDIRGQIEPLARVGLADVTFYGSGNTLGYIDARNLYLDFVTLYGDHPLAPYAQTQVGLCSLKQVNDPTRDQSQTRQAIADLEKVLQRWPDSPFVVAAQGFRRTARSSLAEAEFLVGKFYLRRKAYAAAISRFRGVQQKYPDFIEIEKVKYYLGKTLVAEGDSVEGRLILDQLVVENPGGPYAESARKVLEAAGGSFRTDVGGS
jgi:outer membrane protein assembly factor BamD